MVLHYSVLIPLLHLKSVFGTPLCAYKKEHVTTEYCSVVQDDTTTGILQNWDSYGTYHCPHGILPKRPKLTFMVYS